MSCLKNLLILVLVVGILIYVTEESKDKKEKFTDDFTKQQLTCMRDCTKQSNKCDKIGIFVDNRNNQQNMENFCATCIEDCNKEKFSTVGTILNSKKNLSKKQMRKINKDLSSEESRNRLISELNSEVSETTPSEIQPVEQEVNYAVIGKPSKKSRKSSRPAVEEEISSEYKPINKYLVKEERDMRRDSKLARGASKLEREVNILEKREQQLERRAMVLSNSEEEQRSKFVDEELNRRVSYNSDKRRINQQVEEEEEFKKYLFGKKINNEEQVSEQESEYKIVPFVEEETSQIIRPEGPQMASKYAVLAEEEQKREAQKQFLSQEHQRVKKYEEEEMGIRRQVATISEEESIYDRRMKQEAEDNVSRQRRAYALAEEEHKARIYAEEEQRAKYLLQEEENSKKEMEESSSEEEERVDQQRAMQIAEEEEMLKQQYIEQEEALAEKRAIRKAMKKQSTKYVHDEQLLKQADYTYLDNEVLDRQSKDNMEHRHKKQAQCGVYIQPEYTERINGFAWKNVLDEKDYHPYDSKKEEEEPETLRDAYNSMIPKLNKGKNPHCYLNTHGTNSGTTMNTCSNGYSIYDENVKHKNKTGGVYSNDVCFDPHSSLN